ncbi:MAG: histidine--tRNA ligase [Chitinophagales bacterium]|nr:histidine--tRNA ligase [Chitinophagaceae bacterium]MCB9063698.1 histidine--tRNA ligase [Chitinophagales bacterium]
MSKPSIPQGTRDFSPAEVRKRQYIFNTLQAIFEQYGFQPLETPAMENLTTLIGKYGEEGDRLIFKILNNGLHEKKDADKEKLNEEWATMLSKPYNTPKVTERALRYDLTIPFARYVVMHQHELAFPFRRYQMQPVWRADRPQKGRYREFWQCDADVVGSTSLINEAELLCIYRRAFHDLNLPQVVVKINSRKLLAGLAEVCNASEQMMDITIALDKLDKIGWDGVTGELKQRGINDTGIAKIAEIINVTGTNEEKLSALEQIMSTSAVALEGIKELRDTLAYHDTLKDGNWSSELMVDISLARGLNYYTGVIVEVVCNAVKMGSIGGGGRYDDLTGLFGLKNMSGVGVSFGIDRIYDVIEELNLFPEEVASGKQTLILNFGGEDERYALNILQQLRNAGVSAEIYPDSVKFDKQMKYANKRNVTYVIIVGEEERKANKLSLKNFVTGEQELLSIEEAINIIQG